ncbi:MAG TPA: hypothetical protein VK826_13655 [Bacteroidia bacterium]|nr:hypothetical protein [Bacteroidia bacterium]
MKKIVLLLVVLAMTAGVHAQTRRIAHRSHGGAKHEKYDGHDGNYGNPPEMTRQRMLILQPDTIGDSIVWRAVGDTLLRTDSLRINQHQPENNIDDVSELGKVCSKITQ